MSTGINSMTHQQKVERLIADLGKQGVSPNAVAPPFFRLLWASGFNVPPPLFLGFLPLTLLMGALFAILWGVFMRLFAMWQGWHVRLELEILTTAGVGLAFGLSMAAYSRWKAVRLRLPPWESYPERIKGSGSFIDRRG